MAVVFRKYPADIIRIKLYYGYDMPDGQSISSVAYVVDGEADEDLSVATTFSGQTVSLQASSGAPDGVYQVYVTATTNGGLKLTQQVEVAVRKGVT